MRHLARWTLHALTVLSLLLCLTAAGCALFAIDGAQVEGYRLSDRSPESIARWAARQHSYDKLHEGEAALFTYHVNRLRQATAAFGRGAGAYLGLYRSMASRVEPGVWATSPVKTDDPRLADDVTANIRFVARCVGEYSRQSESELGDVMARRFRWLFVQMKPPANSRFHLTWQGASDSMKTEGRGSPPPSN